MFESRTVSFSCFEVVENLACVRFAETSTLLLHYSAQASYFAVFVESGTRKLRKVVESRTKFLFYVKRVLDSTTVLVLDSTPILLL